jgi:hypothetical protein
MSNFFERYDKIFALSFVALTLIIVVAFLSLSPVKTAGLTETLSLRTILCGPTSWWQNIPIPALNLFTCQGRLGLIAGLIGAAILVFLMRGMITLSGFNGVVLAVIALIGYVIGFALANSILDFWYIILPICVIVFFIKREIKKRKVK